MIRKGFPLIRGIGFVSLCAVLTALPGCQDMSRDPQVDPLEISEGADLQRSTEVQLVEQMAMHRNKYQQYLELLYEFYDRQGNHLKASWVQREAEYLKLAPRREYLVIAEVAGPDLRARESIADADVLYEEGIQFMKAGSGLFINKKKLYEAMDKFNSLITNYPTSDKIDDAAFQIAEIYRRWLESYDRALLYYQRVWQWDPQTPLPARFYVAKIYDEVYHDRVKALDYYNQAINLESDYPENVVYAQNRIDAINQELAREK
jgi:tetratricopeptide (TPR) repeat protein